MSRYFITLRCPYPLRLESSRRRWRDLETIGRRYRRTVFRALRNAAVQCACVAMMAVGATRVAHSGEAWPRIPVPTSLALFTVGENIAVNGMVMRVQGFVSPLDPVKLAQEFRQSLGAPLVEKSFGNMQTLGRTQDFHYLTVSIAPAGAGSRGTVSAMRLNPQPDALREFTDMRTLWLSRMPTSTQLPMLTISQDGALRSYYFAFTNHHSLELNLERIKNVLAQERMTLVGAPPNDAAALDDHSALRRDLHASSQILFFKGIGKTAEVVALRSGDGVTALVLNLVLQAGHSR